MEPRPEPKLRLEPTKEAFRANYRAALAWGMSKEAAFNLALRAGKVAAKRALLAKADAEKQGKPGKPRSEKPSDNPPPMPFLCSLNNGPEAMRRQVEMQREFLQARRLKSSDAKSPKPSAPE